MRYTRKENRLLEMLDLSHVTDSTDIMPGYVFNTLVPVKAWKIYPVLSENVRNTVHLIVSRDFLSHRGTNAWDGFFDEII